MYSPLPQKQSLSTIWLNMSHFIRSVSNHDECGIKLKLLMVGVDLGVFWEFSVVAMATGARN